MTLARLHDLPDGNGDHVHFFRREPITACEITGRTGRAHISANMRKLVVNPVEAPWLLSRSAVNARLGYHIGNFAGCHVAGVYPLISPSQYNSAPFVGSIVPKASFSRLISLLFSHVGPALFAAVSAFFPLSVTLPALIRETQRAFRIPQKEFRRGWKLPVASVTNAVAGFCRGSVVSRHSTEIPRSAFSFKDGPHWQLPWKQYP